MNILFVTTESMPFNPPSELSNFSRTLSKTLNKLGGNVKVILPYYESITNVKKDNLKYFGSRTMILNCRSQEYNMFKTTVEGVEYYFIDNDYYFNRENISGYQDDCERFYFFARAVIDSVFISLFNPDIMHLNDWATSIVALLINKKVVKESMYPATKSILTIHNLASQGRFDLNIASEINGILKDLIIETHLHELNFLRIGIDNADVITTTSKNYADDLLTFDYGMNISEILINKKSDFYGITTGIDYEEFDPKKDPNLYKSFSLNNLRNKRENKTILQGKLLFEIDKQIPLMVIIVSKSDNKGLELIEHALNVLLKKRIQIVAIGEGETHVSNVFKYYTQRLPDKVKYYPFFNEEILRKLFGAADLLLMPSKYEPCGFCALIAQRYGVVPIVHETGALKDTVVSHSDQNQVGTGFSFNKYSSKSMVDEIDKALRIYESDPVEWDAITKRAMKVRIEVKDAAKQYLRLYKKFFKD